MKVMKQTQIRFGHVHRVSAIFNNLSKDLESKNPINSISKNSDEEGQM
jgi:hypothetical protein